MHFCGLNCYNGKHAGSAAQPAEAAGENAAVTEPVVVAEPVVAAEPVVVAAQPVGTYDIDPVASANAEPVVVHPAEPAASLGPPVVTRPDPPARQSSGVPAAPTRLFNARDPSGWANLVCTLCDSLHPQTYCIFFHSGTLPYRLGAEFLFAGWRVKRKRYTARKLATCLCAQVVFASTQLHGCYCFA